MILILKTLWNKYKALEWWKKILLFLPLLVVIVLICVFMFWKPSNDSQNFENAVDYGREQVDERIKDKETQDKILIKKDKKLASQQAILEKEIKDNEKKASDIVDSINRATNDGDLDELQRIHRQLNANR